MSAAPPLREHEPRWEHVLVVDDEPAVLESLERLLSEKYWVTTAWDSAGAREVLGELEVAVILADERLPGESGVDLLAWAARHHPDAVRILLTGYADADKVIQGINEARVFHYVRKPWENAQLLHLIENGIEYRRSRAALERSERVYRELFHNAHIGIVRMARDGSILEANPAFGLSLGYERLEDLVDRTMGSFCVDPEAWTELAAGLDGSLGVDRSELALRARDGRRVHLLLTASIRTHADEGEVIEATTLDLTAQRHAVTESAELREQLRRIQRHEALYSLSGGIAHDFNNQMTVILSAVEFLAEEVRHDEELLECAEDIAAAAEAAAELSRQLVTFAREGGGHRYAVDPNAVVTRVGRLIARTGGPGITVEQRLTEQPARVLGNAAELLHCLLNLGLNAVEAMPGGGTLQLETRRLPGSSPSDPGTVEVLVQDDGEGMDDAVAARAFDPFFTTKTREAAGGTGLGLSLARSIVEQHGGALTVRTAPGEGSCFTVSLPACASDRPSRCDGGPDPRSGDRLTVVLADDEVAIRKRLGDHLGRLGHRVLRCQTGKEAVDLVVSHPEAGLVVLDVVMPVLGGDEAFGEIRAHRPDIPVLFTTGHLGSDLLRSALADDRVALLQKPFNPEQLVAAMAELLARAGSR